MARRIGIAFLIFLVIVGAAGLWVYHDVLGPARAPDRVDADSARPLPERQRAAEQTLERLKNQVRAAAPAPPTPEPSPSESVPQDAPPSPAPKQFDVTISEQEANDLVQGLPEVRKALEKAKVEDLQVRFEPGRLVAEARVPAVAGMKARLTAAGRVVARDGDLAYETESVRIGSFPAPEAVRDEIDRQLSASVRRLNRQFRGDIQEVQLREGALEVRGTL